ncbi:F0F1 ATP synthase subunit gamma [Methylomagnum sp.]
MSRRAELEQRMGRLAEISDIMTAMKTMALIETRKFGRFMSQQLQLVESIEASAADFLAFHPAYRASGAGTGGDRQVLILIGSERGFCGDFNETVLAGLAAFPDPPRLIAVGRRLAGKLEGHPRLIDWLDGPNVAEEVRPVLDGLMDRLHRLQSEPPGWTRLSVLAHDPDGGVATHAVLPMMPPGGPKFAYPPRLNLAPAAFFAGLTDHYLIAKLPCLFHGSLLAENRRRLEHMERALGRMQTKIEDLGRRRNALRQEEITEEIEVILLSAESLLGEAEG